MIRDGLDVHYYAQPVDSEDQAVSLAEYLKRHGQFAEKDGADQVIIPIDAPTPHEAATTTATVYTLVSTWRLFWEHSDKGVFELPVYVKE